MFRLGILMVFLMVTMSIVEGASKSADESNANNIILVNERAGKTIRLKSVLSMNKLVSSAPAVVPATTTAATSKDERKKQQKIFWSFKRIYAMPDWTTSRVATRTLNEMSQVELMISLDAEVQDTLRFKYSTSSNDDSTSDEPDSMFDLIISNLTYADSGLYKCNLWNQKTIYYKLIVSSRF